MGHQTARKDFRAWRPGGGAFGRRRLSEASKGRFGESSKTQPERQLYPRMNVSLSRRKSMAKRRSRKHSSHPYSPTNWVSPAEDTAEAVEREQQDGLIQEQEERTSDKPPTIIPFRSEEAPAAAARPDPQAAGENQEDVGHASAEQRLWCSRARRLTSRKKPRKRWDWSRFKDLREKFTPEERLERAIVRYRKGKLLSGQNTQPRDTAATIIPFPSEQAQAADGSGDPPDDT
jgi:hypothetical protein